MSASNAAATAATIDSAIVFLAALVIGRGVGVDPNELVFAHPRLLAGLVVPLCLVVWWRGFVHTRKLQAGQLGWWSPIREGFIAGFLPVPLSQATFIVSDAFGAGQAYPSIGASSLFEWISYAGFIVILSTALGAVGAAGAAGLSSVNRALLPWLSS